jgi:hypothetical protein
MRRSLAVALMVLMTGCSVEHAHRYTCDASRNCAGHEVVSRGMSYATDAASTSEAEVEIVDECEAAEPCGGALACWALCKSDE